LVKSQDSVCEASASGEDSGFYANPAGIFAQGDITDIMVLVFDSPVPANGVCGLIGRNGVIGKVERGFGCGFPKAARGLEGQNASLDFDDGGDIRLPIRSGYRQCGVEHGNGSGFMTVALFVIDRPDA
jgi:hypothetical protein